MILLRRTCQVCFSPVVVAVLLMGAACSLPERPEKRFTQWTSVQLNVRRNAKPLGYVEANWNGFNHNLERNQYISIPIANRDKINTLMGTDHDKEARDRWDCWINHYRGYTWGQLDKVDVQDDYRELNWTSASWNGLDDPPNQTSWGRLTEKERKAAGNLCYVSWSWNNNSLPTNSSSDTLCFSSYNEVQVLQKGRVAVDQLEIGDYVMAGNGAYSRMYSWSHFDPLMVLEYLQIYVSGAEKPLEISGDHMVLVNNKMLRASEVNEGDMLGESMVEKITTVHRQGAYAPVTESGDILVSNVLASCFAAILDHSRIDQHSANHALLAPIRYLCAIDFGICENETYTNGYSDWIYHAMKIVQFVNNNYGPLGQAVASLVVWPILAPAYMLVKMLTHPRSLFWMLACCVGAIFYWRRTKRSHVKAL